MADLEEMLPRADPREQQASGQRPEGCKGGHFPEAPKVRHNATACGCSKDCHLLSGWPDEEYYSPHRGRVSDDHWSEGRAGRQHGRGPAHKTAKKTVWSKGVKRG